MMSPYNSHMSINLVYEVAGSLELMEPFSVYITNIAVMARGMAVLKCSLRKYTATFKHVVLKRYLLLMCSDLSYNKNTKRR